MAILGLNPKQILKTNRRTATLGLPPQPAQNRWFVTSAWLAVAFMLIAVAIPAAQAQSFNVIYTFTGQKDGANPYAGVNIDKAGNLYGTTNVGGEYGNGTVFKLKRTGSSWIISPLYSFTGGNDGAGPRARVVVGPDGGLYGTTFHGGGAGGAACNAQGCGTVFNLRPPAFACKSALCPWKETILYRFAGGTDGGEPLGDLIFDKAGNIYGTASVGGLTHGCGGPGCGVVFELARSSGSWTQSVVHTFNGGSGDGSFPNGGVVFDQSGNLYGTTFGGGSGGLGGMGTVFQLTPSGSGWEENILYNFQGLTDGSQPNAGVVFDGSGNLYGSTVFNGTGLGGTVFELTPSGGNWTFNTLYGLVGSAGPFGNLFMDATGNLYGTTYQDGLSLVGSIFELTPSIRGWTYTSLHDFTGDNDGELPISSLVFDSKGNMYGTTTYGGAHGDGVVVEVTP